MAPPRKPQQIVERPFIRLAFPIIRITPPPVTSTLALGFLFGNLAMLPMLAWIGKYVPVEYRNNVADVVGLWKDGMLLILGYYFAKVVNAGDPSVRASETLNTIAANAATAAVSGTTASTAEGDITISKGK